MNALVTKALEIAQSQLGARETGGENRGPQVDRYLASIGLGPGAPWCAAFVYWSIDQAAQALGVANPYLRSGYCPTVAGWAQDQGILVDSAPQPGDVFLLYTGRARHTGLVTGVNGTILITVEGNTNINGSPEGTGVFRRTRPVSAKLRYVRWGQLADPEPAEIQLYVSGHALCSMPVNNGRSQCPVRMWGENLGFRVDWDNDQQSVTFDGQPLDVDISLIDGTAYAPLRDLVASAGLRVQSVGHGGVWVGR